MAAAPAGKPTGKVGSAVNAARTLTDPNATAGQKATEGAAAAAELAATAAGGAITGRVVGKVMRSKNGRRGLLAVVAFILVNVVMLVGVVVSAVQGAVMAVTTLAEDQAPLGDCDFPLGTATGLQEDQVANAQAILRVVLQRGLGAADSVIAIMTALDESSLTNVDYGDDRGPDSRGLFQQRDSWGPLETRMDPAGAAGLFLDALTSPGLTLVEPDGGPRTTRVNANAATSRATYAPWLVAQSVQRSFDDTGANYRARYAEAVSITVQMLGDRVYREADVAKWSAQLDAADPPVDMTLTGSLPPGSAPTGDGCAPPTLPPPGGPSPGAWGGYQNGQIPASALCRPQSNPQVMLRCDAAAAVDQLSAAMAASLGRPLSINEGYRDLATQRCYYYGPCGTTGAAAPPGTSNHGWALAIDINGTSGNGGSYAARKTTPVYRWMAANAATFGFRENLKLHEAWHWEFYGAWTG